MLSKLRCYPRYSKDKYLLSNWSNCKKCGTWHKPRKCPAFDKICSNCHKANHFKIGCKVRQVNDVDVDGLDKNNYIHDLWLLKKCHSIGKIVNTKDEWVVSLKIENKSVVFKCDTGAQVNILSIGDLKKIVNDDVLLNLFYLRQNLF